MNWKILEQRAYVPYSQIPVACIVLGTSGKYYPGVRVENISFPITIPAIQAACCFCLADGDTPESVILKDKKEPEQLDFWVKEFNLSVNIQSDIEDIEFGNVTFELEEKNIKPKLISLLETAVTPQSDFPVSTVLTCNDGKKLTAVNVEVSEWSKGLCSERIALAKAISYGISGFQSMSLHTLKGEFSSPCGACRQVIIEHLPDHKIDFYHADGSLSVHYTSDLLPLSFSTTSLKK
jgi:homotetrameric cytidine deaminase